MNLKNVTGSQRWSRFYDALTKSLRLQTEVDGETKELTRGELSPDVRGAAPDLRAKAYQELYRAYSADSSILGQMGQTLTRDWRNENLTCASSPVRLRRATCPTTSPMKPWTRCWTWSKNAPLPALLPAQGRHIGMSVCATTTSAPVVKSDKTYAFGKAAEMVLICSAPSSRFRQTCPACL